MAIIADDIRFYLSGGAGNPLATASLGGIKSSTRVVSQTAVPVGGLVTGVTFQSANNNAQGNAQMTYNPATGYITWQPPASGTVYSTLLSVTGTYTIGGTDGNAVISVVSGSLPVTFKSDTVTITNQLDKVFPVVSAAMSLVGAIQYRCLYVLNNHPSIPATGLKLYVLQDSTGPDNIFIGLDPAGVGDGAATGVAGVIGVDTTPPAGVVFTQPLSSSSGLAVATVNPGQVFSFWQRRTVPPSSVGYVAVNTSKIGVALTS